MSKPWIGHWKRAPLPCSSSLNIGGRVICCARSQRAPVTPAPARKDLQKRSRQSRKSWKSAFKTSARSRSQKGSLRGSTCGKPTCWESIASEPGNWTEGADLWGQGSVYMFFDHDFCNKMEIILNSFKSSFWGDLQLYDSRLKVNTESKKKHKNRHLLLLTYVVCVYVV